MLIGTDFNEFTFDISRTMTWPEAEAAVRQRQGERADAFIAAFKKAYPKAEPKEMTYVDTGFRAVGAAGSKGCCGSIVPSTTGEKPPRMPRCASRCTA